MQKINLQISSGSYSCTRAEVLIIGSGAAGLNAAVQLYERGVEDIVIITEKWGGGTSNNAGSDKQTYYRLAFCDPKGDTVRDMAETLWQGGCMQGDIALIEAAGSLPAFFHLVTAGVPFPHDSHGIYPGYQTDHDQKGRGTSAGPLTSKLMFESLARKVVAYRIPIIDRQQLVRILMQHTDGEAKACGAITIHADTHNEKENPLEFFQADHVILATGGPGELFEDSVYPSGQFGATGVALDAGVKAQNLTEFQFGIASTGFRWNLSGSYQQVLPHYYSIDNEGVEYNFLAKYFKSSEKLSKAIFLKGYQWPFNPVQLGQYGSSVIDLMVHHEIYDLGRRVFLDYRRNPLLINNQEMCFPNDVDPLVLNYLEKAEAIAEKPVERLSILNKPALDLFRKNGIDLQKSPLEISVSAQHCNGGLKGSIWWESSMENLYAVGEVNGSHGVYRPGGSALNSGQVGGYRVAMRISEQKLSGQGNNPDFGTSVDAQITDLIHQMNKWVGTAETVSLEEEFVQLRQRMQKFGGLMRSAETCNTAFEQAELQLQRVENLSTSDPSLLKDFFRLREQLIFQQGFFYSLREYLENEGGSRGSYLILCPSGVELPAIQGKHYYRMDPENGFTRKNQLVVYRTKNGWEHYWDPVRPIPETDPNFEKNWREYREKNNLKR